MSKNTLAVGDQAPDFTLPNESGELIHLYKVLKQSPAVLFFYVRAFTPVCTAEVCGFSDRHEEFADSGAAIFGIGPDAAQETKKFAGKFSLPYSLLIDVDGEVRRLYGVPKVLGLLPGRSTYVIGQDGKILHITRAGFRSRPHIEESLAAVRRGAAGT